MHFAQNEWPHGVSTWCAGCGTSRHMLHVDPMAARRELLPPPVGVLLPPVGKVLLVDASAAVGAAPRGRGCRDVNLKVTGIVVCVGESSGGG